MHSLPKTRGGFRSALKGRADVIQTLRDNGMRWKDIAKHFADDRMLGRHSAAHFMSEWSKLRSSGLVITPERCQLLRQQPPQQEDGYSGWQVWPEQHHG